MKPTGEISAVFNIRDLWSFREAALLVTSGQAIPASALSRHFGPRLWSRAREVQEIYGKHFAI